MSGERYYTTKIWRQPSLIGCSSAVALSTSMDRLGELVISTWKRPCKKIQNGSEFPELVAQNFRNPQAFGDEHVSYYVILATTQPAGRFGISSFHSLELNLPVSANASYTAKNVFHFQIAPRFRLPRPYTMVVQKDLDAMYA